MNKNTTSEKKTIVNGLVMLIKQELDPLNDGPPKPVFELSEIRRETKERALAAQPAQLAADFFKSSWCARLT